MLTHGLGKYFDTESRKAGVYPDIVEILMSHKLQGTKKHYFKPGINDINELLEGTAECKGYVTAIDYLTINDENRLKKENQELIKQGKYDRILIQEEMNKLKEQNRIISQRLMKIDSYIQYSKYSSQKLSEHTDLIIEEKHLIKEYESIPNEQKQKRNIVYKKLLETNKRKVQAEKDYKKLMRDHSLKQQAADIDDDIQYIE